MMRCPSCGAFVASTDTACWKCNEPLKAEEQGEPQKPVDADVAEPAEETTAPPPTGPVEGPPSPAPTPGTAEVPPAEPAPPVRTPEPPVPRTDVSPPGPEDAREPGPTPVGDQGTPPPVEDDVPVEPPEGPPEPDEGAEGSPDDDFVEMDDGETSGPAPPPKFEPRFGEREPEIGDEGPAEEGPPSDEDRPPAPRPVRPRKRRTAPPRPKGPAVYRPRRGFSEGRQESIAPPTKWKNYNIGTFISLAAVILLFVTFLLPWYHVDLEAVDEGGTGGADEAWETDGETRIVEVNGYDPIRMDVSPFTNNTGVGVTEDPMEGYLPIPMGVLWGTILAISMFYRFTRNKPWRRGKKFIKTGILLVIFLIVFIVIFTKLHTALPDAGGEVFSHIGGSPFRGTYEGDVEGWEGADVSIAWGVDVGYILAAVAAVLFIVGGTLEYIYGMRAKRELEDAMAHIGRMPFRERKDEEPKEKGRFRRK